MAKEFSGIFLKRYPETIIIPIMQTGVEGKIAFRACFFTPSRLKWRIFEFYQMVCLEMLSPLDLLGFFLRDRLQGTEENWKAAGFPVQRWDGNPHNNVIMQRKSPAGRADGEQFAGSWACGLFAYSDDVRKFIDFTVRRQKSQQDTIPLVSFLLYKQWTWMSTVTSLSLLVVISTDFMV